MTVKKAKRHYNRITPANIAIFKATEVELGNGSAAIRKLIPNHRNVGDRAFMIRKKAEVQSTVDYIDKQLQQIGIAAVDRLGELVNSSNESVATKNVHYSIDHIRGQATKKSITLTGKLNIQNVLD